MFYHSNQLDSGRNTYHPLAVDDKDISKRLDAQSILLDIEFP